LACSGCNFFCNSEEEHNLRVFQNRELRIIFGARREEVAGDWRRLDNEKICNLYCSSRIVWDGQIKEDDLEGACST
jgi:hypothetical protein